MFVSVLGLVPEMDKVVNLCEKYDVILLEDNSGTDIGALKIHGGAFVMKGKSASAPIQLQTHDGNEDIEVDPDGFIKFETAGTEKMRIKSSGIDKLLFIDSAIYDNVAPGLSIDCVNLSPYLVASVDHRKGNSHSLK